MFALIKSLPSNCPACDHNLRVSVLQCSECSTEIRGQFALPLFLRLSTEEQQFIIDFVKYSGNIKSMSKQLQLSYPTVRNRLDDLITHLNSLEDAENPSL